MSGVQLLSKSKSKEHHPSNRSTSSSGYSGVHKASKSSGSRLGAFYSTGPVLSLGRSVQAKMNVGSPGGLFEREADSVAERIMSGGKVSSISRISSGGVGSVAQRQEEEEKEEEELIQAKNLSGHNAKMTPSVESHIQAMKGSGEPLPEPTRAFFEPRFGRDFSRVRVHTDARAADAARKMNARAYTVGKDIVFGAGHYAPGTSGGKRLLAHELSHIVQQKGQGNTIRKKEDESKDVKMSWWEQKKKSWFEEALNEAAVPKKQVMDLFNRAGSAITEILKYPDRFVNTLIKALVQGFQQFNDNISKHLKAGFMSWLFGTMIKAGIHLPEDFSSRSILTMVLQVLGITQALIRQKVAKVIGEKNVSRIEKAWQILSTFMKDGIGGLWEMLKDYLSNLKETVVGEVRKWLTIEVIKAAVVKVVSMFNPVSGLITIIKTIYNVIKFLIERASQIMALFNAIAGSVVELAMGNVTRAANKVEDTLARLLPVAIGFLASLLGIGGIAAKIKGIIKRLQIRVNKAIDMVIGKVVGKVSRLFKRRRDIKGKPKEPVKEREVKPDLRSAKDIVKDTLRVKLPKGARQVADVSKVLASVAPKVSPALTNLKAEEVLPGKPKKEGAIGFKVKGRAGKGGDVLIDAVRYSKEGTAISYEERWKMGVEGVKKAVAKLVKREVSEKTIKDQFPKWENEFGFKALSLNTEKTPWVIEGEMSRKQSVTYLSVGNEPDVGPYKDIEGRKKDKQAHHVPRYKLMEWITNQAKEAKDDFDKLPEGEAKEKAKKNTWIFDLAKLEPEKLYGKLSAINIYKFRHTQKKDAPPKYLWLALWRVHDGPKAAEEAEQRIKEKGRVEPIYYKTKPRIATQVKKRLLDPALKKLNAIWGKTIEQFQRTIGIIARRVAWTDYEVLAASLTQKDEKSDPDGTIKQRKRALERLKRLSKTTWNSVPGIKKLFVFK
jgi:hypothetical protein